MQSFRDLLADQPDPDEVTADARRLFPSRELLQETYSRVQLAGHYLRAKYALAALVERLESEGEPDDEPDPRPDEGDPVARIAALSVVDDEAVDLGGTPKSAADVTRRELRMP